VKHSLAMSATDGEPSVRQCTRLLGWQGLVARSVACCLAMARGRHLSLTSTAMRRFDALGLLQKVTALSRIVVIPPTRHTADEKVRYCRIAGRGGCLLILQQNQFSHLSLWPLWSNGLEDVACHPRGVEAVAYRCSMRSAGRSSISEPAAGAAFPVDRTT
jgi:hypothetical protein